MKGKILSILMLASMAAPCSAFAEGWGAIACDVRGSGACGASSGWADQATAEDQALAACERGGYTCYLYRWEHNECIYGFNGSYACN